MTTLDFLGGRYQQGEQILPGAVGAIETFRASETSTGRSVYLHRVMAEEPAQQVAVMRLLSEALLHSAEARKMILEVGEHDGCPYIVTEAARQCLMLRQWLKSQADQTAADQTANQNEAATQVMPRAAQPAGEGPRSPEPGEFTRLFQQVAPMPQPGPPPASAVQAAPPVAPKPPAPVEPEPGEFTRIFQAIPSAAKPGPPPGTAERPSGERPSKGGYVQRPSSPPPGEFTKIFSQQSGTLDGGAKAYSPPARPAAFSPMPDFGGPKADESDFFKPRPPAAPSSQEPGVYTRLFGPADTPPPVQQPSTVAPPPASHLDDRLFATSSPGVPPAPAAPVPRGPSEFTRVIQGFQPQTTPPPPQAAAGSATAAGVPPLGIPQVKMNPPPNPLQAIHPPAPPQLAQAAPPVLANPNKKLIILLAVLTGLALLLIVLVVLTLKK